MSTAARLTQQEARAHWEGAEARRRGDTIDANPHWPQSDKWWAWRLGWRNA